MAQLDQKTLFTRDFKRSLKAFLKTRVKDGVLAVTGFEEETVLRGTEDNPWEDFRVIVTYLNDNEEENTYEYNDRFVFLVGALLKRKEELPKRTPKPRPKHY